MASPLAPAGAGVDWDARYTAGDTPWDKGGAHPALRDWMKKHPLPGRVLVPGCGAGHDVRAIAAKGSAFVLGLDISPSALRLAESFLKTGNETYLRGDFLSGEAVPSDSFDAIFEHTCFCAIPPGRRGDYARASHAALDAGGLLLAVFFTNPEHSDPHSPPFGCDPAEIRACFEGDFEILEMTTCTPTFPERLGRETLGLLRKRPAA